MLNSGKRNILTLVLSEKKILNETKNHNPPPPPFKLNGRSLIDLYRKMTEQFRPELFDDSEVKRDRLYK